MAMAKKITFKKPDAKFFKGWLFVAVLSVVLTILVLIDSGEFGRSTGVRADGSTGCVMLVQGIESGQLNVRAAPDGNAGLVEQTDPLVNGDQVDARLAVTNGYRQLADGNWASADYLTTKPGSTC